MSDMFLKRKNSNGLVRYFDSEEVIDGRLCYLKERGACVWVAYGWNNCLAYASSRGKISVPCIPYASIPIHIKTLIINERTRHLFMSYAIGIMDRKCWLPSLRRLISVLPHPSGWYELEYSVRATTLSYILHGCH